MSSRPSQVAAVQPLELLVPPPKALTYRQELELLRLARASGALPAAQRLRLAELSFILDAFDDAVELLTENATESEGFQALHLLSESLLARETARDNLAAKACSLQAVGIAADRYERARALATLGKAMIRLADIPGGRARLVEALDHHVANKDAYKRLAMVDLQANLIQQVLEQAEHMVANDVVHARVLAIRPVALAMLGRRDAAVEAFGLDAFLHKVRPAPPDGWPTLEAFNADLRAELLEHPSLRYDRYGAASSRTWRVDEPSVGRPRMVPELQRLIQREATAYVATLSREGHPWLAGRPARASLRNWCVMTDADGFEDWHVHQNGWLSGVYYVDVPDYVSQGTGIEGCISFGLPPGIAGDGPSAAFGATTIRPFSGLLMLFPSHAFHRTFPHRGARRRICFAFDLRPE